MIVNYPGPMTHDERRRKEIDRISDQIMRDLNFLYENHADIPITEADNILAKIRTNFLALLTHVK